MNSILQDKRVCFIVGTLGQGGAERQLYFMLSALRTLQIEATVLCLTKGEYWEDRIQSLGVHVRWVGEHDARPWRLLRIIREVRRLQPDVLQSSHFYTNLYAALAGAMLGIPAIGALRNDCISEVAATGRMLGRLNLALPRWIAGNSRLGIRNAQQLGVPADRLLFLPNVVDTGEFHAVDRSPHNPLQIVTVGRLVPQKRVDRFIDVIGKLRSRSHAAVKGVVVGDGPLRNALQQHALAAGLTDREIEFRGVRTNMREVYDEADIVVLTSDWEGTPNALMEAMASGLPVVSTNVGGVDDLIEDGKTGRLVARDDVDGMVHAVAELAGNAALRRSLGREARRYVAARHSPQELLTDLSELYRTVVNGGKNAD